MLPDYQTLMLPTLRFFADGKEHTASEHVEAMAREFRVTEEERRQMLPSGTQPVLENRAGWARTYLKKAGLIKQVRRAVHRITERGRQVLAENPERIDNALLSRFPEFRQFMTLQLRGEDVPLPVQEGVPETGEERLEKTYQVLRSRLAAELLAQLKSCSPAFFEKVVVDVLLRMGYGGSMQDAGRALGKSGDGGIDGIIKEDRLGLDVIYLQAKRWDGVVGRPEIQKFVGALTGQRARKGVFITTSSFTKDAVDYVAGIDLKIVLIDGETLASLMIDFDVGVTTMTTYTLKRIDTDYFAEE